MSTIEESHWADGRDICTCRKKLYTRGGTKIWQKSIQDLEDDLTGKPRLVFVPYTSMESPDMSAWWAARQGTKSPDPQDPSPAVHVGILFSNGVYATVTLASGTLVLDGEPGQMFELKAGRRVLTIHLTRAAEQAMYRSVITSESYPYSAWSITTMITEHVACLGIGLYTLGSMWVSNGFAYGPFTNTNPYSKKKYSNGTRGVVGDPWTCTHLVRDALIAGEVLGSQDSITTESFPYPGDLELWVQIAMKKKKIPGDIIKTKKSEILDVISLRSEALRTILSGYRSTGEDDRCSTCQREDGTESDSVGEYLKSEDSSVVHKYSNIVCIQPPPIVNMYQI